MHPVKEGKPDMTRQCATASEEGILRERANRFAVFRGVRLHSRTFGAEAFVRLDSEHRYVTLAGASEQGCPSVDWLLLYGVGL